MTFHRLGQTNTYEGKFFRDTKKIIIYLCSDYTGFVISVHDSDIPLFELQHLVNVCDNIIYINVT